MTRWFGSLVWAVLENHGYDQVAALPAHARLAREGFVLRQYRAVAHPSGPNYRAMASGETWGGDEEIRTAHPTVADAATAAGVPTSVYHLAGTIAARHNPLRDLQAPAVAERFGFDAFAADLASWISGPHLVYAGWDDLNDGHSGPLDVADRNLGALLDALAGSKWFNAPDAAGLWPALFLVYDEAEDDTNRVFAAWWGKGVRAGGGTAIGYYLDQTIPHTHYGFCRTVTDNWGAAPLGQAATEMAMAEAFAAAG